MKHIGEAPLIVSDDDSRLAIPSSCGYDLYELAGRDGMMKARYRFAGVVETEADAEAWVSKESHKTRML